jgi:rubrerythrin
MAHHEMGHAAEAQQWLEKSLRRTAQERESTWRNRLLTLNLLRQEAESLLGQDDRPIAPVVSEAE